MRPRDVKALLALASLVFSGALVASDRTTVHAQDAAPAAAEERIWQGVFSAAQADRGKAGYAAYCSRCHGPQLQGGRFGQGPPLTGDTFWVSWERSPLSALMRKVSGQMPADAPASLRDDEYTDIVSHILQTNGIPAGKSDLPAKSADLDAIRLVRKVSSPEAPNFSVVQVVGCVSEVDGAWRMTRGTKPAVVQETTASAVAVKQAEDAALGTEEFRLLGVAPFRPETLVGRKVIARGLINRVRPQNLIDVLAAVATGASCGS
jgi:mono/diheme cytochrome c family protein